VNLESHVSAELWQAVRRSYETDAWSNSILDAINFLGDAIRAKTGLQSDGTALAGQALGGKNPKLRLNRLQTESEQSIQNGVEQLLRGTYQAFRNPRSHGKVNDTQTEADSIILFVNYLLSLIGHAKASFSLEACVARALEASFVPNERYAKLLVAEIPARERLQVVLNVYQRKIEGDGEKLRYFFDALIPELPEDERTECFAAISAELRETNEDTIIRTVLQALRPPYWLEIDEIARIRVENRILKAVEDGRYDIQKKKCIAGAYATWATDFLPFFTLKEELLGVLVEKLRSTSRTSQDYVFRFFLDDLDSLAEKPPQALTNILTNGLKAGDVRFFHAIDSGFCWEDKAWPTKLTEAKESFVPAQPTPEDDDEMPF
jgi:uncharacterized protein (TIGR02391 family)